MFSFKIGLLVLEKNILKVFTIYGNGEHLGHVTTTTFPQIVSMLFENNHIHVYISPVQTQTV